MIEFFVELHERAPFMAGALVAFLPAFLIWVGGFLTTMYNHRQQSKREKFKELRSNLYAAVLESNKVYAWVRNDNVFYVNCSEEEFIATEVEKVEQIPPTEIRTIASLYFPEIYDDADALLDAAYKHHIIAFNLAKTSHGRNHPKYEKQLDDLIEAFAQVFQAMQKFQGSARSLMAGFLDEKSHRTH